MSFCRFELEEHESDEVIELFLFCIFVNEKYECSVLLLFFH